MLPQAFDGKALMRFAQSDKTNDLLQGFDDYFMDSVDNPTDPAIQKAERELHKFIQDTPESREAFREYERATDLRYCLSNYANFALGFWLALHPDAILQDETNTDMR